MKKLRLLTILAVLVTVVTLLAVTVSADPSYRWELVGDDEWMLYDGDTLVTDEVVCIDGKWYGVSDYGYRYSDCEFYHDGYYYRARTDGTLYVNAWYSGTYWDEGVEHTAWYYYGSEGKAAEDFLKVDGTWYYFRWDGSMATDEAVWSANSEGYYIIDPTGTKYTKVTGTGWLNPYGTYFYAENGIPAFERVIKSGGKLYAVDGMGRWVKNDSVYCYVPEADQYCRVRAKADGTLYANEWYSEKESYNQTAWYYYLADGTPASGWQRINGVYYFFYSDGQMVQDTVIYDGLDYYVLNEAGDKYQKLSGLGWQSAFGNWYYMEEEGPKEYGLLTSGSKSYYLSDYKMVVNDYVYFDEEDHYAGPDGVILKSAWALRNGKWIYADENMELYNYGVHQIGSEYYFFEEGYLYTLGGEIQSDSGSYFVTNGTGVLYRNKWYKDNTGWGQYETGWAYYGADARRVQGFQTIGGKCYYFENGISQTKTARNTENGVYWFDKDGIGTKWNDGWHEVGNLWHYVTDGKLASGRTLIDGTYYFFYGYGEMATNDWFSFHKDDKITYYLFGGSGAQVTKPGWVQVGREWFYVNTDGTLKTGWLGNYYLDPYMVTNDTVRWNDDLYYANNAGLCSKVKASGMHTDYWGDTVYIKADGKLAKSQWQKINNHWYYFGETGYMVTDYFEVDGVPYLFDSDGVMVDYGWCYLYGSWVYSKDGHPIRGLHTIDGKQYLFSDYGYLLVPEYYSHSCREYNGTLYMLAADGHVIRQLQEGWNQVGGDWYYVLDGGLLWNTIHEIDGATYGFDDDGKMLSGGMHYVWGDRYLFGADGRALRGWQKLDGKWTYGMESGLVPWCDWMIDGELYVFVDGYLQVGTFTYGDMLYTTNSSGVVISRTALTDGLYYRDGYAVYLKNGEYYHGWIGNSFFDDGWLVHGTRIEYNGKYYYMDNYGQMVTGWYETDEYYNAYVYAYADGHLACNEWLKLGNTYYYFQNSYMVWDTVIEIDGELHEFDENGKWLGKYEDTDDRMPVRADGWQKVDGKWYYYRGGAPEYGYLMIDGAYYYLGYNGMVANGFAEGFYFGSNGVRVNYTGWKQINKQWLYFSDDHTIRTGLFFDGGNAYYTDWYYDDMGNMKFFSMTNSWYAVDGRLYKFGSNSAGKQVTTDGWHQIDGSWFYLKNGAYVTGFQMIDGVGYYFDTYNGAMYTDGQTYVDEVDGYAYFGASGAMITKAGWHQVYDGNWIYVRADGSICHNGIYKIDGTVYAFNYSGYWIQ